MSATGAFTLNAGGVITANVLGYNQDNGSGKPRVGTNAGGSHGGIGSS